MLIVNYKADMTISPISNVDDKMDDNTTSNKDKVEYSSVKLSIFKQ